VIVLNLTLIQLFCYFLETSVEAFLSDLNCTVIAEICCTKEEKKKKKKKEIIH